MLPCLRLHDLRHLHVSLLVEQGIDVRTVADRLGHTRSSFTFDVYAHLFEEQRLKAALSLEALLDDKYSFPKLNNSWGRKLAVFK
jgi:integrase